jgi:peptidoglycan/xylan/chitin deacetylase (PgdA/CDA1 family)
MSIAPRELRNLVQAILRSGHRIVSLSELLEQPAESGRVALTFDDGLRSIHEHALPALQEDAVPATLFLTTGHVGRDSHWSTLPANAPVFPMLDWSEVENLQAAGWDIQAHTETHPHLPALDDERLGEELEQAAETIERRVGRRPDILAYPYGSHDDRTVRAAGKHYRFAVTTQMAELGNSLPDPHRVPRLDAYYFREPRVHARFGALRFRTYLRARAFLRGIRQAWGHG